MFFNTKYHFNIILYILFFILIGCQIQESAKNHGILFLENRANKLVINKSNMNDVIDIIGQPHTKSIDDDNLWLYLERTLGKGKYHRLGKHVLKTNNTLVLSFDKFGVLKSKEFYSKEDIKEVAFSNKKTNNELTKKSFVQSFLSSVKSKMYSNRK